MTQPKDPKSEAKAARKVALEIIGGREGDSISLSQNEADGSGSGYRIAGPKPWGGGSVVQRWDLDEADLDVLIREAQDAKRFLAQRKKVPRGKV